MTTILIGLALVFLDLDMALASGALIDVLPDVLGYIIVLFGLRRMGAVSYEFSKCVTLCIAAAFCAGVMLGTRLFPGVSMVMVLMELAELIMQLCMLHFITKGVRDAEMEYAADLWGKWLRWAWVLLSVTLLLNYVMEAIGVLQSMQAVAALGDAVKDMTPEQIQELTQGNSIISKISGYAAMASDIAGILYLGAGYASKVRMDEEAVF